MTEINEFQAPKGAQRYYMQAQAHDQAATKYKLSVKTANPEQAKNHRAIGKLHGVISAALNKIAAKHTGLEYSQGQEKKAALMAKKNVTEGRDNNPDEVKHARLRDGKSVTTLHRGHSFSVVLHPEHKEAINKLEHGDSHHFKDETGTKWKATRDEDRVHFHNASQGYKHSVDAKHLKEETGDDMADDINEDIYTIEEALDDLVFSAVEQKPGDFAATFGEMIRVRALERIEDIKVQVAQDTFADDVQEDVEQVDEISGAKLGAYIQAAHKDKKKRINHGRELSAHPSVKKITDKRSEYYARKEYDSRGRSKHQNAINNTYEKEGKAKEKLDPNYLKTTNHGKRSRGIEKALNKLSSGKLSENDITEIHGKRLDD